MSSSTKETVLARLTEELGFDANSLINQCKTVAFQNAISAILSQADYALHRVSATSDDDIVSEDRKTKSHSSSALADWFSFGPSTFLTTTTDLNILVSE